MERASQALAQMDYLDCERLCLQALEQARQQDAWDYYARILLPLQEARRQRRMIAADGSIRLGTGGIQGPLETLLDTIHAGCVAVTRPHTRDDARRLHETAHAQHRLIEVLYFDNDESGPRWTARSFAGPQVSRKLDAPPAEWVGRTIEPRPAKPDDAPPSPKAGPTPADWFLDASEALGDAALTQVDAPPGSVERLAQLEAYLEVVRSHEILHQRLGDAARAVRASRSSHV